MATVPAIQDVQNWVEVHWDTERQTQPPVGTVSSLYSICHQGIDSKAIERCRKQGILYVIVDPIRLYMAHPKWPTQEGEPVDERTKYYCGKDVERHLRRWQKAASDKKIYQFQLDLEDPTMYLPETFKMWRKILQQGEQL